MNATLATNVRALRESKHWTQQHLADAADILLRTVQRVEKGDGASAETLSALAGAFDCSIDFLQTDFPALLAGIAREQEAIKKTHHLIPVVPVTSSSDIGVIGGAVMAYYHCPSPADAVQDAFAALQANLGDMVDLWDDVDPVSRREWMVSAFEQVQAINRLGFAVVMGKRHVRWTNGLSGDVLYVVAMPIDQVLPQIAFPKTPAASQKQDAGDRAPSSPAAVSK